MSEPGFRLLPVITPDNEPFWTGGARGALTFLRCNDCGYFIHPPSPRCPRCLSADVAPHAVSGKATVFSFTINHQQWNPIVPVPYVVAIVEIVEQPDLRLTTNIVGCDPDDVKIGMEVQVTFEQHGDIFIPLFTPAT